MNTLQLKEEIILAHGFQRIQSVLQYLPDKAVWWKDMTEEYSSSHGTQEAKREQKSQGQKHTFPNHTPFFNQALPLNSKAPMNSPKD